MEVALAMSEVFDSMIATDGYNKIYPYQWKLHTNTVPGVLLTELNRMCPGEFGWHFIAHDDVDVHSMLWYEKQDAYITFKHESDCVQAILELNHLRII